MLQPLFGSKLRVLFPALGGLARVAELCQDAILWCSFPGLLIQEGMILSEVLGLACGEIQFGPNPESAANAREILGTGFKNSCASGQGRT